MLEIVTYTVVQAGLMPTVELQDLLAKNLDMDLQNVM